MALGNARDDDHEPIEELFGRYREQNIPRHTTDYVLDELCTLLFRRVKHEAAVTFMEGLFDAAETGRLRVHRITSERFQAAWRLRKRFDDKNEISFTDLTSMVVIEGLDLPAVLTDDEHFAHVHLDTRILP